MAIDHQALAKELEDKFNTRFTDKDEDYVRSLKLRNVSPPLIYPYFANNNSNRRGNFNQQRAYYNQGQREQYRSNEDYSNYKRRRN